MGLLQGGVDHVSVAMATGGMGHARRAGRGLLRGVVLRSAGQPSASCGGEQRLRSLPPQPRPFTGRKRGHPFMSPSVTSPYLIKLV